MSKIEPGIVPLQSGHIVVFTGGDEATLFAFSADDLRALAGKLNTIADGLDDPDIQAQRAIEEAAWTSGRVGHA